MAMRFGSKLLIACNKMYVCGDRLSEGMYGEIIEAIDHYIPVQVFNRKVFDDLREYLVIRDIDPEDLHYEDGHLHFALAMGADELAPYWEVDHHA